MRWILASVVLFAVAVVSVDAQGPLAPAKSTITDETIIDLCGGRLAKLFAQLGPPTDVAVKRGDTPEEDDVYFAYDEMYGFRIRNKMVRTCFIFGGWKEPIRGIRIGDSRDDVAKTLGTPNSTVKDKTGSITAYGYDLKDLDAFFFANFDEKGKVWRVEISLK